MPLPYEVIRLFTSPVGYLVEIEHPRHLIDTPETGREWLWVTDRSVTSLRPLRRDDATQCPRIFREAQLQQLDDQHAQLSWPNGERYTLIASAMPVLPAEQHQLIHNHLS
ncbi:hypothetical protein D9M68_451400 [compost metagenome]